MEELKEHKANYVVIDSVYKSYKRGLDSRLVLNGIRFIVSEGSFVTIFGPNGCGKTTLFYLISGLITPDKNTISINGKPAQQSKIGFLFQNFADTLLPWKNCFDNIAFPLEIEGIPQEERKIRVMSLLNELEIDVPLTQYPYQCSGGQKQLVAIARSLIQKPDLLLMDEPFSALDFETRMSMENKILDIWSKSKVTTLFISHDIDEAVYLSDKVVVFSKMPTMVVDEILVDLPRPRNIKMMESTNFYEIRNRVMASFLKGYAK